MIEDLTTTIKAQLYERVSSPLLSSFLLSWCGWNYKFILVVLSGMSSYEKITYIDMNLFPNTMAMVVHGALLPLITSLLLIFVYPVPAEFIYKHVKIKQRRLKEIQQSIDDDSPISKEQARKIRRETLENQLKYEGEIEAKTSENARLKEMITELQQQIAKTTESLSPLENPEEEHPTSEKEAELAQEEFPDLLAVYESAKADSNAGSSQSRTDDLDESERQHILDIFIRNNLLDYIGKLIAFSGVKFDVAANNGKLQVLIGSSNGGFSPYVTAEYDFESALKVLDSVRNALAHDTPPKILDGIVKQGGENYLPSHNSAAVKDYIITGIAANKSISEIRRDLLEMGVPESVFNVVMADIKRSDTSP